MPAAVRLRLDFSAGELRRLAAATKNADQGRHLLSLAAVLDVMSRAQSRVTSSTLTPSRPPACLVRPRSTMLGAPRTSELAWWRQRSTMRAVLTRRWGG